MPNIATSLAPQGEVLTVHDIDGETYRFAHPLSVPAYDATLDMNMGDRSELALRASAVFADAMLSDWTDLRPADWKRVDPRSNTAAFAKDMERRMSIVEKGRVAKAEGVISLFEEE